MPIKIDLSRDTQPAPDGERVPRCRGALLGLAAGDALGTTLEFTRPGSFAPISTIVGGGPFHLQPGQWTDDTSMALCLATSLVEHGGFDARDQLERYVRWWRDGYLSSTGSCFDIGVTVRAALGRFSSSGDTSAGSTDPKTAGNGSLMRLAPVALAYADNPRLAIARAADSSRTTHAAPAAIDACRYFAGLLVGALRGEPRERLVAPRYSPVPGLWDAEPLVAEIDAVAAGSFKIRQPPQVRGTGYVVASLEAALWAFYNSENFRDGCLLAVNLGEDADTTGAVYGQIAGAYYGESDIPADWRALLAQRELITGLADVLCALTPAE
jgi:ADP-ribosylglycohydrolase